MSIHSRLYLESKQRQLDLKSREYEKVKAEDIKLKEEVEKIKSKTRRRNETVNGKRGIPALIQDTCRRYQRDASVMNESAFDHTPKRTVNSARIMELYREGVEKQKSKHITEPPTPTRLPFIKITSVYYENDTVFDRLYNYAKIHPVSNEPPQPAPRPATSTGNSASRRLYQDAKDLRQRQSSRIAQEHERVLTDIHESQWDSNRRKVVRDMALNRSSFPSTSIDSHPPTPRHQSLANLVDSDDFFN